MQRENDALQKIVAQTSKYVLFIKDSRNLEAISPAKTETNKTSSHLVDIFAMVPQNLQRAPTPTFSGQDARLLEYQDALATAPADAAQSEPTEAAIAVDGVPDWLSEDEDDDTLKGFKVVRGSNGPFLGGFTNVDKRVQ